MRKARLLLTLPLVLAVACGGTDEPEPSGSDGEVTGTIVVQASGSDSEIQALQTLADAFEEANEGTTVELVPVASQGDHVAKLALAFASGEPPDVFLLNYRRFGQFAARDVIDPIEDSLGDLSTEDFYEPPIAAFTINGQLLCLPQNVSSSVIYFNPALFEEADVELPAADWSWQDMTDTARSISEAGIEAVGFGIGVRTIAPFVWSAGGEVVDDTESPTAMTLDNEPGREALQFLLDLQQYGTDATERAAEDPEEAFARGELAMFYDSRRAVPLFRDSGLDFDVVALPADEESVSLLASDAYCVSRDAGNIATAREFARFAVGPEGGQVLAETGRTVPSYKELAESEFFLDTSQPPASAQVFLDVIPTLRQLPNVATQSEAEEVADGILELLFAGTLTLDEAVAQIEEDTAAVYERT